MEILEAVALANPSTFNISIYQEPKSKWERWPRTHVAILVQDSKSSLELLSCTFIGADTTLCVLHVLHLCIVLQRTSQLIQAVFHDAFWLSCVVAKWINSDDTTGSNDALARLQHYVAQIQMVLMVGSTAVTSKSTSLQKERSSSRYVVEVCHCKTTCALYAGSMV